jgi:hypothetical protein
VEQVAKKNRGRTRSAAGVGDPLELHAPRPTRGRQWPIVASQHRTATLHRFFVCTSRRPRWRRPRVREGVPRLIHGLNQCVSASLPLYSVHKPSGLNRSLVQAGILWPVLHPQPPHSPPHLSPLPAATHIANRPPPLCTTACSPSPHSHSLSPPPLPPPQLTSVHPSRPAPRNPRTPACEAAAQVFSSFPLLLSHLQPPIPETEIRGQGNIIRYLSPPFCSTTLQALYQDPVPVPYPRLALLIFERAVSV